MLALGSKTENYTHNNKLQVSGMDFIAGAKNTHIIR